MSSSVIPSSRKWKVLIIRAGALGDTLMLLPALAHLSEQADIIVAGRYPGIDYLRPYVKKCMDMDRSGFHRIFMDESLHYAYPLLQEVDHVAAFTLAAGDIRRNLGCFFPGARIHVFPPFPPSGLKIHIALYMAGSLAAAGLPIDARKCMDEAFRKPTLHRDGSSRNRANIVLHPGSGSARKNYPPRLWIELMEALLMSPLIKFHEMILLVGPAEIPCLPVFKESRSKLNFRLNICPERDELISILNQAVLYVGHDSGITHLASMLGAPVIALFRDSSIDQWRPLGPRVRVIRSKKRSSDVIREIMDEVVSLAVF